MDLLLPVAASYATQLPVLIVWLIGLILAFVRRKQHPKVARLVSIALIGFIIVSFVGTYLTIALPMRLYEQGTSAQQIGVLLAITGLAQSVIRAVLWGLVVAAIFGWRNSLKNGEFNHDRG